MAKEDARQGAVELLERQKRPLWRWLDGRVLATVVASTIGFLTLLYATAPDSQRTQIQSITLLGKVATFVFLVVALYGLCCSALFVGRFVKECVTRYRVAPLVASALLRATESYGRLIADQEIEDQKEAEVRMRALEEAIQRCPALLALRQRALFGEEDRNTEGSQSDNR